MTTTSVWPLGDVGLGGMDRLAGLLSLSLGAGDFVALRGDLGAGKTTLARFLIGRMAGAAIDEIPSPTFALVQTYDTARAPVTHIDCYRLGGTEEADELGIEDALQSGTVLLEWPERIEAILPADRLEVELADGSDEDHRRVALAGHGAWAARLTRLRAKAAFCERSGWGEARFTHLQGDASTRTYAYVEQDGKQAILMDSPKTPDGPPVRDGRPYSAIAHLAEDVRPFVAIAGALRTAGFSAPEILAQDLGEGFLIIEDLGDKVFGPEIAGGADPSLLYGAATDVLVALRGVPVPDSLPLDDGSLYRLPDFDRDAMRIEVDLLLDWYWPFANGQPAPEEAREAFDALWVPLFEQLQAEPPGWILRDYHSPNLIWLPQRDGLAKIGIIDFQDALRGSAAYDLMSLVQDARRDVPEELERALRQRYCAAASSAEPDFDRERFDAACAIVGAQRNTKILGIFARLASRDGKPGYLAHLPRVYGYLERNLSHPVLAPLRDWYKRHLPAQTAAR